jgi:hypothetical protein
MTRHFVTDVPAPSSQKEFGTVGAILRASASDADATAATEDPNAKNRLSAEEHEHVARALESAQQKPEAIASWHRAAVGHALAGNAAGVVAAITHAEKAAGNNSFSPHVERKATAADASPGDEVYGDDDDVQPMATARAPDPTDGEILGSEPDENTSDEV